MVNEPAIVHDTVPIAQAHAYTDRLTFGDDKGVVECIPLAKNRWKPSGARARYDKSHLGRVGIRGIHLLAIVIAYNRVRKDIDLEQIGTWLQEYVSHQQNIDRPVSLEDLHGELPVPYEQRLLKRRQLISGQHARFRPNEVIVRRQDKGIIPFTPLEYPTVGHLQLADASSIVIPLFEGRVGQ